MLIPVQSLRAAAARNVRRGVYRAAQSTRAIVDRLGTHRRIGVTGSAGKTTTTRLLAEILGEQGKTLYRHREVNGPPEIARTLLRLRPGHRYCLQELSLPGPGAMDKIVQMMRPQVGVVTVIENDHYTNYRGLDNTAAEKGKLIESLPPDGCAVLNADDERVLAMAERTTASVVTYGLSAGADVRGRIVSSSWPERLSMEVSFGQESVHLKTRLVGKQWATSVLAAVAAALALKIPLALAAASIERVEAVTGRVSVSEVSKGVTFLRDDFKAPFWTVGAALEMLGSARAKRRIAIIGTISDYAGASTRRYRQTLKMALDAADEVYFVGPLSHVLNGTLSANPNDRVHLYETVSDLDRHFHDHLQPGDLVLLKGSGTADHLGRLALSWQGEMNCWLAKCGISRLCDDCRERAVVHGIS